MGTYDVALPARKKIVFPSICVVCEKPNPNGAMSISILGADTSSFALNVADLAFEGSAYNSNTHNEINGIPACKSCEGSLKWYHRILKFATYTSWLPGLLLMLVLPLPIWIGVFILIGFVIAPAILSMIFPPAFGATFLNGNANFEFKSKKIADEFTKLNVAPNETAKI